jgi:mono/diheme cytochrome c family protein
LGAAAYWVLTRPDGLGAEALAGIEGDLAEGERIFRAAGCASCHVAPDAAETEAPVLAGGQKFPSPFGTFVAPNISPHPQAGIGGWSELELVNAVHSGVSPGGRHYFPALPYAAYGRAELQDLVSLDKYLRTLPESDVENQPHEVPFPFSIRRNVGLWKQLFVSDDWVLEVEPESPQARGRYLVEALGHCAECHTPRNLLGGLDRSRWMGGAPNPSGKGNIPNITPARLDWSQADLVAYFTSGFTPEFDTAGGEMAKVVRELSKLPVEDREAIAAYVKALPAVE